jgi:tetratricopeptide (TPR) repeat protein
LGIDNPQTTPALVGLAGTYKGLARYSEAEALYRKAIAINEKELGPEHPDVARVLDGLAVLHVAQGHLSRAEPIYKRAIEILEQDPTTNRNALADVLEHYSALLRDTKRSEESREMLARARSLRAAPVPMEARANRSK